jgi:hypothetical protein
MIGGAANCRSSGCCNGRRSRTDRQSGEHADQGADQGPAVALFGDLLYREFSIAIFRNDRRTIEFDPAFCLVFFNTRTASSILV